MLRILLTILIFVVAFTKCKVRNFGEFCNKTFDECIDYRMFCSKSINDNVTKCWCDRFHEWSTETLTCIQKYNASVILEMVVKISDNLSNINVYYIDEYDYDYKQGDVLDELNKEQTRVFRGAIFSALFILGVGISCVVIVIGYCFYQRRSDAKLSKALIELREEREKKSQDMDRERVTTSLFNV